MTKFITKENETREEYRYDHEDMNDENLFHILNSDDKSESEYDSGSDSPKSSENEAMHSDSGCKDYVLPSK